MERSTGLVISTQGLSKNYNGVKALRSLDLQVPERSIFGFLGPNGAGKTTTIKLLLGLAKPSLGSGSIFGLDIVRDSLDIRMRIGYLAQDPRFYEYMTARETLRFKARFYYHGPDSEIEARIAETLVLVGLANKADRPIKGFSGGERQRLGIAQAQVNHPDLLILNEPAASLDPMGRRDVLEVMDLMLGSFFDAKGPVLAIAIAVAIASMRGVGQLLSGYAPWIVKILPEALPLKAYAKAVGVSLPSIGPIPIVLVSLYSVLFVVLAIWRFWREEF